MKQEERLERIKKMSDEEPTKVMECGRGISSHDGLYETIDRMILNLRKKFKEGKIAIHLCKSHCKLDPWLKHMDTYNRHRIVLHSEKLSKGIILISKD